MNIASGIPKFFPLTMIQQEGNPYVRDDTIFITVMIDFGNIPERIFTYVLSLNPRSTMHIQQMLIKQEAQGEVLQQPHEIDIDEYGISCEETRRDENVTNDH
ncbi:unnamed protein product [Rotaria sordida]|uniref:MATH domain-containing protein n=1 Tax=Rotaria sordida TaxID=392033 RepID=A0A815JHQ5_9BILA|nr:unnamed protein product [Rotaria sordida]CAF4115625.1 unnamed protein product [Rotaria sordida]